MSQQTRSRPVTPPEPAEAAPTSAVATALAPSNAPTIFLLALVVGMMAFIAWWAFLGKGARAKTNATLPPPPRLDAVPVRLKPSPKPLSSATPAPDDAAPNASEAAPTINEVPASPAPKQAAPAKSGTNNTASEGVI